MRGIHVAARATTLYTTTTQRSCQNTLQESRVFQVSHVDALIYHSNWFVKILDKVSSLPIWLGLENDRITKATKYSKKSFFKTISICSNPFFVAVDHPSHIFLVHAEHV